MFNKKYLTIALTLVFIWSGCASNQDLVTLTKKKPETLPAFTFYTMDDQVFTNANLDKDKGHVLMYLDPECIFCQTAIQRFTRNIDEFEEVDFLVISPHSRRKIEQFIELHELEKYPQIKVVRDTEELFPTLFYTENYPVVYLYNKEGKFLRDFQGLADVDQVEDEFKNDY